MSNLFITILFAVVYLILLIQFAIDVKNKSFNKSLKLLKVYMCMHYLTIVMSIVLWSAVFVQSFLLPFYFTLFIFAYLGLEKSEYKKIMIKAHLMGCVMIFALLGIVISLFAGN